MFDNKIENNEDAEINGIQANNVYFTYNQIDINIIDKQLLDKIKNDYIATKLAFKKIYSTPRNVVNQTFLIKTERDVVSFSILGLVLMFFTFIAMYSFSFVIMIVPTLFEILSIDFINASQDEKNKNKNHIIFAIHLVSNLACIGLCLFKIPYDFLLGITFVLVLIVFLSGFAVFYSVFSCKYPPLQDT